MAHLTLDDRIKIELMLKARCSLTKIADELDKAISTISREIIKHSVESDKAHYHRIPNRCIHRMDCDKSYLCSKHYRICKKKACRLCEHCNEVCPDYVEEKCAKLFSPPYVCNGCVDEIKCTLHKCFYIHAIAHKEYRNTRRSKRRRKSYRTRAYIP